MKAFHSRSVLRALRRRAKGERVRIRQRSYDDSADTMSSIDLDVQGFYTISPRRLGELGALLLAQAEADGVSHIRLHYGRNRMVYTIEGADYDMVPCPPPSNVDLVRALASAARTRHDSAGSLAVSFADCTLNLTISHHTDSDDPYLEVSGFTGSPCEWVSDDPAVAHT